MTAEVRGAVDNADHLNDLVHTVEIAGEVVRERGEEAEAGYVNEIMVV